MTLFAARARCAAAAALFWAMALAPLPAVWLSTGRSATGDPTAARPPAASVPRRMETVRFLPAPQPGSDGGVSVEAARMELESESTPLPGIRIGWRPVLRLFGVRVTGGSPPSAWSLLAPRARYDPADRSLDLPDPVRVIGPGSPISPVPARIDLATGRLLIRRAGVWEPVAPGPPASPR